MIGKGPYGETTVSPDNSIIYPAEVKNRRNINTGVGISLITAILGVGRAHEKGLVISYRGAWSTSYPSPTQILIRIYRQFNWKACGCRVLTLSWQSLMTIADSTNQLKDKTFISNKPDGKEQGRLLLSFTNERETWRNGAKNVGEHLKRSKAADLSYTAVNSWNRQFKDMIGEQTIRGYPNITIVESEPFYQMKTHELFMRWPKDPIPKSGLVWKALHLCNPGDARAERCDIKIVFWFGCWIADSCQRRHPCWMAQKHDQVSRWPPGQVPKFWTRGVMNISAYPLVSWNARIFCPPGGSDARK